MRIDGKPTTVNVTIVQVEFLDERNRRFNFSAFVRDKLDEYMKLVEVKDEKAVE